MFVSFVRYVLIDILDVFYFYINYVWHLVLIQVFSTEWSEICEPWNGIWGIILLWKRLKLSQFVCVYCEEVLVLLNKINSACKFKAQRWENFNKYSLLIASKWKISIIIQHCFVICSSGRQVLSAFQCWLAFNIEYTGV